ncbi:MAG: nicotinamide-nucleotide amidohydrolase family protein [Candidatus Omnitrophica bacterium]|nr:nicotinamide-nucleotide amidohydrolase family protein [Candidatus Omnitrophota bacterium]
MGLEQKILRRFLKTGKTLSIAESCTGGLIADNLTNAAGASAFFLLGVVAYDNAAKTKTLRVPSSLLVKHGAVSAAVAAAMAEGVRKILKTDVGLGVTGIAGPGGGSAAKPVGLVFIAQSTGKKTTVKRCLFKGSRLAVKKQAAQTALKILAKSV